MSDHHQANERIERKLEQIERLLNGLVGSTARNTARIQRIEGRQQETLELDRAIVGLLHEVLCELRQLRRPRTFPATSRVSVRPYTGGQ